MKRTLTDQERKHLDHRVAHVEKQTGSQIVLAVIERSDSYAELPWKAFALGTAVAAFGAVLLDLLRPGWHTNFAVLLAMVTMLATGASCALLCIVTPKFARAFLDAHRAEVEVRQYAQSLFLSRELFATRGRTGILLLVSIFERQVILLPDSGIDKRLNPEAKQNIVSGISNVLAKGQVAFALETGLDRLEAILSSALTGGIGKNEIPNIIVEEKGL